jgi:hypothetical protein
MEIIGFMKLEDCKKCGFHHDYIKGQVLCKYSSNINSMATYRNNENDVVFVIGCLNEK